MNNQPSGAQAKPWNPEVLTLIETATLVRLGDDRNATLIEFNGELRSLEAPIIHVSGHPNPGTNVQILCREEGLSIVVAEAVE